VRKAHVSDHQRSANTRRVVLGFAEPADGGR
jgi:hypothetical protein